MSKQRVAIALAILCIAAAAQSQSSVYLVADINQSTTYPSLPANLRALNGGVVFNAHGDGDSATGGDPEAASSSRHSTQP